MYQFIVLGLGFLLLFGGGYLIKHVDKEGFLNKPQAVVAAPEVVPKTMLETIPGTYVCSPSEGCQNTKKLILDVDNKATLISIFSNGSVDYTEIGTWSIPELKKLSITFIGTAVERYDDPHSFLIEHVGSLRLARITFNSELYQDIHYPTFIRQ